MLDDQTLEIREPAGDYRRGFCFLTSSTATSSLFGVLQADHHTIDLETTIDVTLCGLLRPRDD
jgi:hypothetical protein